MVEARCRAMRPAMQQHPASIPGSHNDNRTAHPCSIQCSAPTIHPTCQRGLSQANRLLPLLQLLAALAGGGLRLFSGGLALAQRRLALLQLSKLAGGGVRLAAAGERIRARQRQQQKFGLAGHGGCGGSKQWATRCDRGVHDTPS